MKKRKQKIRSYNLTCPYCYENTNHIIDDKDPNNVEAACENCGATNKIAWLPQEGPQMSFCSSDEFEVLFGGAAGGGKSDALLMEGLRQCDHPRYRAIIFRKTTPQLGKLIDRSLEIFPKAYPDAVFNSSRNVWKFPSGAQYFLRHLEDDKALISHDGQEYHYVAFDELQHFCLPPETDILTINGWKKITDININDKVMSLNIDNRNIEYCKVNNTFNYDYNGEMYRCKTGRFEFLATPNHKMIIEGQKNKKLEFCQVKDLKETLYFPRTGKWTTKKEIKIIKFNFPSGRGLGSNQNSVKEISCDTWLEFLGWYLSEGSCRNIKSTYNGSSPEICIRQIKFNKNLDKLIKEKLPWRSIYRKEDGYYIYSRQLYNELVNLGNTYTKRVPKWVMNLSKRQLEIFFNSFVEGDGYKISTGAINIGLANEELIDDLQEIAIKLGRTTYKYNLLVKNKYKAYYLSIYNEKIDRSRVSNKKNIEKIKYTGTIHCISVENNHNFLVRYNGRTFWSGNSEGEYLYLFTRCRSSHKGIRCYIRSSAMPRGPHVAWVKARFVDLGPYTRYEEKIENEYTGEVKILTRCFIPSTLDDNRILTSIDPMYEARLKIGLGNKTAYEALRYGNWDRVEGAIFEELDPQIHKIKYKPPPEGAFIFRSMDWGFSKPFCVLWFWEDNDGILILFRELYGWGGSPDVGARMTAPEVAREIKEMEKDLDVSYGVADNSCWDKQGHEGIDGEVASIMENFEREDVYFEPAKKDPDNGISEIHTRLSLDKETGKPWLYITENCKHFWRTMPMLQPDKRRSDRYDTTMEDHVADTLYMGLLSRPLSIERALPEVRGRTVSSTLNKDL